MGVGSLITNALKGLVRDSDVEDSAARRRRQQERRRRQRDLDQRRQEARLRKLRQSRYVPQSFEQRAAFLVADIKMSDILGIRPRKRRRQS